MKLTEQDRVFKLKKFQSDFFLSKARYPAFVGAWGTGKSMTGIAKAMYLSETFPNNLGVIFRKEFTDLRDSTLKDFETYTGLKVNSSREVVLPNKSTIMFRHLEELNNIQNMNLGWFWIEQAEELDTDREFFTLFGRLRRADCQHCGFITANTRGRNWIYKLWKVGELSDSSLSEAVTADNADVLGKDFLASLELLKKNKPEIYNRFVLNSWDVSDSELAVIPERYVRDCIDNKFFDDRIVRKITVADISGEGNDETVIYDFLNYKVADQEIYSHRSLMDTVGRIQAHALKNGSNLVCVDKIGEGAGVYSRLQEIYFTRPEMTVYGFDSRVRAPDGIDDETYFNYKTYAWFKARDLFFNKIVCVPSDEILISQLCGVNYHFKSEKKYCLESKEKIREKLGHSPDRADAFVMGLDALSRAVPLEGKDLVVRSRAYIHPRFREVAA